CRFHLQLALAGTLVSDLNDRWRPPPLGAHVSMVCLLSGLFPGGGRSRQPAIGRGWRTLAAVKSRWAWPQSRIGSIRAEVYRGCSPEGRFQRRRDPSDIRLVQMRTSGARAGNEGGPP